MGNMIRARAKWVEDGEKPTSYFLNLENRHFTNKIIPKLIKSGSNEIEITDQNEILTEVELFYKTLYSNSTYTNNANIDDNDYVELKADPNGSKLNNIQAKNLEGKITYSKATAVLKNMANNKSPGSDRFTSEFIKVFWKQLGNFIVRSFNFGYK